MGKSQRGGLKPLPKSDNLTNTHKFNDCRSSRSAKFQIKQKKRCKNLRIRIKLYVEIAEKPYFKWFLSIEKCRRNSIKITVALWPRWQELNLRLFGPKQVIGAHRSCAFSLLTSSGSTPRIRSTLALTVSNSFISFRTL